jgi:hypothetical protein
MAQLNAIQKISHLLSRCLIFLGVIGSLISCQVSDQSKLKIIGGTPVRSDDPIARRVAVLMDQDQSVICTVTPLTQSVFVTAAHCIHGREIGGWTIQTGLNANERSKQNDGDQSLKSSFKPESLGIERTMLHSLFAPNLLYSLEPTEAPYDIALIKTSEPSAGTIPVPILRNRPERPLPTPLPIVIAGYGRTIGPDASSKGVLQKASLNINKFNTAVDEFTSTDLDGKMGCHGDSGGPAFYIEGTSISLIGIVSRGDGTCRKGTTVFTDLTQFWPFITEAEESLNFQLITPNN